MRVYQMDEKAAAQFLNCDPENGLDIVTEASQQSRFRRFWKLLGGIRIYHKSKFYYADVIAFICYAIAVVFSCLNQSWPLLMMTLIAFGLTGLLYFAECLILFRMKKKFFSRIGAAGQKVQVIRRGERLQIASEELVKGDLVLLEEGSILYGDARILSADNLYADEKFVFGSTIPARKTAAAIPDDNLAADKQENMLWKGSFVSTGSGCCVITALGEDCYIEKTGGRSSRKQRSFFYNKQNNIGHISSYIYIILVAISLLIAVIFANRYVEAFLVMAAMTSLMMLNPVSSLTEWTYYRCAEKLSRQGALIRNIEAFDGMNREQVLYYDADDFIENRLTFSQVINFHGSEKSSLSYFALCVGPGYLTETVRAPLERHHLTYEKLNRSYPVFRREHDEAGNLFSIFSNNGKSVVVSVGYWQKMLPYINRLEDGLLERIQDLEYHGKMVWLMANDSLNFIPSKLDMSMISGHMEITALVIFNIPVQRDHLEMIGQLRRASMKVYLVSDYTETLGKSIASSYDMDGILPSPPDKPCYTLPQLKDHTLVALDTASPIEKDQANVVLHSAVMPQKVIYQVKCMFCGLRRCLNFMALWGLFLIFTVLALFLQEVSLEKIIYPVLLTRMILIFPCYYLIESVGNCNQYRRSLVLGAFCGAVGFIAALVKLDMALFSMSASAVLLAIVLWWSSRRFRPIKKKDLFILACGILLSILPWIFLSGSWLPAVIFSLFPPLGALILNLFY